MALLEKQLIVKRSGLPNAGKGLFTTKEIPRGTRIVEYKGVIKTWKEITDNPVFNGYVFYVNKNHVIDAKNYKPGLAQLANDAKGLSRIEGVLNNCKYEEDNKKVYIVSTKKIPAGAEILVGYGKEYWDVVKSLGK
ncbi:SET domain-containing protein [Sediminibacterium roseum]|uniref:SET domain-containing protein n=1 Tax=Sediminibacterium roseum TaxID=1978412 RepID=A0ABW9ZSJ2_9BACT|nr:SET domain-containing protein [Sediminibacterium roseum]NCI48702.1 SET domain-containing protein [Sediminibacterium roseum]